MTKRLIYTALLFFCRCIMVHAQGKAEDKILGVWLSEEKDGKIEVYKTGNIFSGKLIWTQDNIKDTENPDPKLRSREVRGIVVLTGLKYQEKEQEWIDGKIYDPDSGRIYDCKTWLKNGKLFIRGRYFVFTRTTAWTPSTL